MTEKIIGELCQVNPNGTVMKSLITMDNYKKLKKNISELDIEISGKKTLSYRQYCKLFSGYLHKKKECMGEVCCQAITADGDRCKRPANRFVSIDLTEKQLVPKIPKILKDKLGVKLVEELKLIGFANTCCFYCWQHAAMYLVEGATYTSNLAYYLSHPEDVLKIFFENVKVKKAARLITYSVEVSHLRSVSEIIKYMYKTSADMEGVLSSYYWGVFLMVYAYDKMKPRLEKIIQSKYSNVVDKIAINAAKTLTSFEK